jgi:hypothetical protein
MMFELLLYVKAFSNIRIQDRNRFLCAENAMNIQAREGVRHGANCILDKNAQHKFSTFFFSAITSGQSSNRSAQPHRSHRTLRDGSFGGALSQALRARSPSQTTAHP